jgi:hypothetical protein
MRIALKEEINHVKDGYRTPEFSGDVARGHQEKLWAMEISRNYEARRSPACG